jgi:hypothetical protein
MSNITEAFSNNELEDILDTVKRCFNEKGNKGVRDYDTLNKYLSKLSFEVDAADIEIGGWQPNSYNRQVKTAPVSIHNKIVGYLKHLG